MDLTKQYREGPLARLIPKVGLGLSLASLAISLIGCAGSSPQSKDLLLIRAAEAGETQEMVNLIRQGADINAIDSEGWTPYLAASTNGRLKAMKFLRAMGARTEAPEAETVARVNMNR